MLNFQKSAFYDLLQTYNNKNQTQAYECHFKINVF